MGIINRVAHAVGFHKTPKASPIPQKQGGNRGRTIKHAPAYPQIPQNNARIAQYAKPLADRNAVVSHHQQSYLPRPPAVHIQQHFQSPGGQYNYSVHTQVPPNSTYNSGGLHVSHTTHSNYPLPQFSFNQVAAPVRPNTVYHLQPGQALYLQTTTTPQAPAYAHQGGWGVSSKGGLHPPYPQQPRAQFQYYSQPQFNPTEFQQHKNALLDGHAPMREAPPPYSPRENIPGAHARANPKVAAAPIPAQRTITPAVRSTLHSTPVAAAAEPAPKPAAVPRYPDVSEKEVSIAKEKLGLSGDKDTNSTEVKDAANAQQADIEKTRDLLAQEKLAMPTGLQDPVLADKILKEGGVHEADINTLQDDAKYTLANRLLNQQSADIQLAQAVLESTLEQPDIVSNNAEENSSLANNDSQIGKAMSMFILSPKEPIQLESLTESYGEHLQELARHEELVVLGDDTDLEEFLGELELFPEDVLEAMPVKDMQAAAQKFIDKKRQDIENYYQLLKPLATK